MRNVDSFSLILLVYRLERAPGYNEETVDNPRVAGARGGPHQKAFSRSQENPLAVLLRDWLGRRDVRPAPVSGIPLCRIRRIHTASARLAASGRMGFRSLDVPARAQ